MANDTSYWATAYGMPDPAAIAARIRDADSGTVAASRAALQSVMLALRFAAEQVTTAIGHVRSGWSTTDATDYLRRIVGAGQQVEQSCIQASQACLDFDGAIQAALAESAHAQEAADRALARLPTGVVGDWTDMDAALAIERQRQAIVTILRAALRAASDRLDAAATAIRPRFDLDFRGQVPVDRYTAPPTPLADREHARLAAALAHDLEFATGRRLRFALGIQQALDKARAQGLDAQLLSYDPMNPDEQGGVAIAIGDVSRASAVSIVVPGVGNSPAAIGDHLDIASTLNDAADQKLGKAGGTASVLWFGYDIPLSWPDDSTDARTPSQWAMSALKDSVKAIDATDAVVGGLALGAFVGKLRPMMDGAATLTLVTHSYGATTGSEAAAHTPRIAGIDNVVELASPGAGYDVRTAADYQAVDPDHVYSLSFPLDPVPAVGASGALTALNPAGQIARRWAFGRGTTPFGPNPTAPEFGAQVIDAASSAPPHGAVDFGQHSLRNYLSGESLAATAAVIAGRYSQVPIQSPG